MSDDRPTSGPAPRWGEYAPAPPPSPAEPVAPPAPPTARPAAPATPARVAASAGARNSGPAWDRVLTIALLVLGVINVLTGIPQMLALGATLDEAYRMQGIGDYTSTGLASALGIAINVVGVVLLLAATAVAVGRLRAGRIAFWVPLVAGVTAVIVTIVLMAVAMLGDPALPAYISSQTGGA